MCHPTNTKVRKHRQLKNRPGISGIFLGVGKCAISENNPNGRMPKLGEH